MTTPLDRGRYGSDEMRSLFTDRARYRFWVRVEGAVAAVQGAHGVIPADTAAVISAKAEEYEPHFPRIAEIEAESRHELVAVVQQFAETCGPHRGYVHHGLTSSDVQDTAMALQLSAAITLIGRRLAELMRVLRDQVVKGRGQVMIGRTHGQHAQPVTLAFKLAVFLDQLTRCLERLDQLTSRVVMGKVSGAVGSLAGLGPQGAQVQAEALERLGLPAARICTQAVARDRFAEFVGWVALTAACLENTATEVRNLQRTEIGEVKEHFVEDAQVGSSAMPHKRNPVLSERVCSLSRLLRSLVGPALENVVTWHERDLVNSANERFVLPEACVLLEEALLTATSVLGGLTAFPERMAENLRLSRHSHLSEAVLLALVDRGIPRLDAYRIVQHASAEATGGGHDLLDVLKRDARVAGVLGAAELAALTRPRADTGRCDELADEAVRRAEQALAAEEGDGRCQER
ncbi:adenylosuccinate lyase [Streptomyces sp. NPDC091272]|uniref:adenylosuccinate lyase n=1 Tax=Streptomyces sp. NPDC091272 TaxID=3365981 RepID=UPI003810C62C